METLLGGMTKKKRVIGAGSHPMGVSVPDRQWIPSDQKGRRWTLVVHGAVPEGCPLLSLLKEEFQKQGYTAAAVAYETGLHGIHPHWQVYFQTMQACRLRARFTELLGEQVGFHLQVARATRLANLKYIWATNKQHQIGWVHYTKGVVAPRDYRPSRTQTLLWLRSHMTPWQRTVTGWLTGPIDPRSIHWVYEPVGNSGKTYLCKYLHYFHGAILTGGSVADMKHAIARWKQITGHFPITILIDLARDDRIKPGGYKGLEQIKNAIFFSGKYQSGMVAAVLPPLVVVFSNAPPRRECMSADRWRVYRICSQTAELVPE